MSPRSMSWIRGGGVASFLAATFAMGACRGLLDIDELPPDRAQNQGEAGSFQDGGTDAAAKGIDPAWAAWRVPPDRNAKFEISEGVARDVVTKLTWQRTSGTARKWSESEAYCAGLDLGGQTGWRLPTRIEMMSLMDFRTPGTSNPFAPYFLDPQWNCYWTLSRDPDNAHWLLGTVTPQIGVSTRDDTRCVSRCVQGPAYDPKVNIPPEYVVANGVVQDPLTRLEWQAYASATARRQVSLEEAEQQCSALALGEHGDWRLPTIKELATLVDERRVLPSFDPRVAGESSVYWTSTLHDPTVQDAGAGGPRLTWRLSFSDGSAMPADDSDLFPAGLALVRCVRVF